MPKFHEKVRHQAKLEGLSILDMIEPSGSVIEIWVRLDFGPADQ